MSSEDTHPQNDFINAARKERKRVEVYLVNGIRLVGYIESFDQYLVMLRTPIGMQGVYKRAISTIQHDTGTRPGPRPSNRPDNRPDRPERSERFERSGERPERPAYDEQPHTGAGRGIHGARNSYAFREHFREPLEPREPREFHESQSWSSSSPTNTADDPFFSAPPPRADRPTSSPVVVTRRRRLYGNPISNNPGSSDSSNSSSSEG